MTAPIVPLMMMRSAGTLKKAGSEVPSMVAPAEPDERDADSDGGGGLHDLIPNVIGISRERFRAVRGI